MLLITAAYVVGTLLKTNVTRFLISNTVNFCRTEYSDKGITERIIFLQILVVGIKNRAPASFPV